MPGPVGAACRNGAGCASRYCVGASAMANGVCTAPINVVGAPCADVFACAAGMFCTGGGGVVGHCERSAATNDACDPASVAPCADVRDYCTPAPSTCQRRGRAGASCSATAPCAGLADCFVGTCLAAVGASATCDDGAGPACVGGACVDGSCAVDPAGASCR